MFDDEEVIEQADNIVEEETQSVSPTETVDQTKAFATRLKEEKAKAKNEAKLEIAQSFGYDSWDEYVESQTNNKILDSGLDPEVIKPMLQDLIKKDPAYVEAMRYKAEKEELEKEKFAEDAIRLLNVEFGTNYSSINDLDEETIKMWNNGTPLDKAYAANNWKTLQEIAVKKVNKQTGKEHLKEVGGSREKIEVKEPTQDEMKVFKAFGFSEQQAKDYLNKNKENK